MKPFGAALVAIALSLAATQSYAVDYLCEFKKPSSRKTIPEQVIVKVASDGKSAEIIDGFLVRYGKAPMKAKSFSDTPKLMKAKWRLAADVGGAFVKFDYFLVYRKARNKASLTLTPAGYDNTESGTGTCKARG